MKRIIKLMSVMLSALLLLSLLGCAAPEGEGLAGTDTAIGSPDTSAPLEPAEGVAPDGTAQGETAKWSVFIYMCGTDLESGSGAATDNIIEALEAYSVEDVNVIVQTGGTATWQNDYVDSEVIQRWSLTDGDMTLVDERELVSMGDAKTLADFLTWGVNAYPAEKTMVLFWDHGGGAASGVTFDELFDGDGLSLGEIQQGLAAAEIQYELIGFDTCLMATLEMAELIAPMANYMVASEEIEPGGGWDYTAWLSYLYNSPEADGAALGKAVCDSYYAKCDSTDDAPMATLSVIDLSKIPALMECFGAMVDEMTGVTEDIDSYREFVQGVTRAENYGGNNENEGYTNMVDLGDLAMNTENVLPTTADNVLTALFDAVVYSVKGENRTEANGISVFFPLGMDENLFNMYAATAAPLPSYVRFIEAVTDWTAPDGTEAPVVENAVSGGDYSVEYETYLDDDGMFCLNVTSGMETVASVAFDLYFMDYDYNEYMLMGRDNDIAGDWETGEFMDNFRGVWPTVNGYYCSLTLLAETDSYTLYSIPIMLNGVETSLRAAYEYDSAGNGRYVVYGAWDGIDEDTGMSSRDIVKLKDGDEVTMLFDCVNWDTGEIATYEVGSFTVNGEVVMEESPLTDGDYAYSYTIIDVFGKEYTTPTVIMECQGGEITVYETEE